MAVCVRTVAHEMLVGMKRSAALLIGLALACGPSTDDADSGDSRSDGTGTTVADTDQGATDSASSGVDDSTTSGDGSSEGTTGGVEPIDLCDTTLRMGISGLAIEVVCDVGTPEECELPATGRMIAVYDEDPRLMVDDFFPTELDPAIVPVTQTAADEDGRFELELPPGAWVLCAVQGGDGYCRVDVIVDDAQRVRPATHYSGNGDSWSVGFCPEG